MMRHRRSLVWLPWIGLCVACHSGSGSESGPPRPSAAVATASSLALASAAAAPSAAPHLTGNRLVLLGTKGGPRVGAPGTPRNPSTLLIVNDVPYVVDCGYGTSSGLVGAGVPLNKVRNVFVTHHHSDHDLELGPVIYNGWVTGLKSRVDVYGPTGTSQMFTDFLAYMRLDIGIRMADEERPDPRGLVFVHDFDGPGVVLSNDDVKVTAERVVHPPIKDAYAYRFETKDGSVVISGDTAYAPALADFAKGADILVHEIMSLTGIETLLRRVPNPDALRKHLLASHSQPEEVGKVAAAAGVKTLVLTHFVPGDDPALTSESWTDGVRKHFSGRIVVGKDSLELPLAKP